MWDSTALPPLGPEELQELTAQITVSDCHMSEEIITCLWLIYFTTVMHAGSAGDCNPQSCFVNANSLLTDSTWGLIRFPKLKEFLYIKNSRKLKT